MSLGEKNQNFYHWAPLAPFEKIILSREKRQIPNFQKMAKVKNGQNLAIFGQNGSRFSTPAESSRNGPLLFFDQQKFVHKQSCWLPFCIFAKNMVFDFGGPLRGPQTEFFPKKCLKSCVEHF